MHIHARAQRARYARKRSVTSAGEGGTLLRLQNISDVTVVKAELASLYPRISAEHEDCTYVTSSLYYNYREIARAEKSKQRKQSRGWNDAPGAINFTVQTEALARATRRRSFENNQASRDHPIPSAIIFTCSVTVA